MGNGNGMVLKNSGWFGKMMEWCVKMMEWCEKMMEWFEQIMEWCGKMMEWCGKVLEWCRIYELQVVISKKKCWSKTQKYVTVGHKTNSKFIGLVQHLNINRCGRST